MKVHYIYCAIIALLLFSGFFGYNFISKRNQKDSDEKIRLEEKVKQLSIDGEKQAQYTDSIKVKAQILEGIFEYMKKHPSVIIEKYGQKRDSVLSLSDDDKIKFLSARLSKKTHN